MSRHNITEARHQRVALHVERQCGSPTRTPERLRFWQWFWIHEAPINEFGIGRDVLALERTFLALVRTSVTASSLGVAVASLLATRTARVIGTLLVALGQVAVFVGLWRYASQSAALGERIFAPDTVLPWFIVVFLGTTIALAIVVIFK
jgi:putative membrane protein